MEVIVNGARRSISVEGESVPLVELLEKHLELGDAPVLVELNERALLKKEFDSVQIRDGDALEIVRMVAGG